MVAAVHHAYTIGEPINHLLTVRWSSLAELGDGSNLFLLTPAGRVLRMVDLFRRWLNNRGLKACHVWVRENAPDIGEHLHIGFHLPKKLRKHLIRYLAETLGEQKTPSPRPRSLQKEGEVACSLHGSWLLQEDTHPERSGIYLAWYLGKGEPNTITFRSAVRKNRKKQKRDGRYSEPQGEIIGTPTREYRHGISQNLKPKARAAWRKQHGTA